MLLNLPRQAAAVLGALVLLSLPKVKQAPVDLWRWAWGAFLSLALRDGEASEPCQDPILSLSPVMLL